MPELDRRDFLAAGGATAFLCTLGSQTYKVSSAKDVAKIDAAAAALPRPAQATRGDPVDRCSSRPPAHSPAGRRASTGSCAQSPWDVARAGATSG